MTAAATGFGGIVNASLSLAAGLIVLACSALSTARADSAEPSSASTGTTGFYCDRSGLTAEQRERKKEVGKILRSALIGIREIDQGFEFEYPADLETYRAAAEFVPLERACCPFFEFGIRLEPAGGRLRVTLTGPEGVKGFIREEFSALFER